MGEESRSQDTDLETKLKLLAVVQNYQLTEVDLVWRRSALFITLNAVGIAAVASQNTAIGFKLTICAMGLGIAVVWLQIHRKGTWYAERFFLDAKNIIASDARIASAFQCSIDVIRNRNVACCAGYVPNMFHGTLRVPGGPSSFRAFQIIIMAFIFGWIAILSGLILKP